MSKLVTFETDMLPLQKLDFNKIEKIGQKLLDGEQYSEALKFYVCLCDGDDYFEAGKYAFQISICYEKLGDKFMAKYWAGLALEQNPTIDFYLMQRQKFDKVGILELVDIEEIT